jgi:hypothetical protein
MVVFHKQYEAFIFQTDKEKKVRHRKKYLKTGPFSLSWPFKREQDEPEKSVR